MDGQKTGKKIIGSLKFGFNEKLPDIIRKQEIATQEFLMKEVKSYSKGISPVSTSHNIREMEMSGIDIKHKPAFSSKPKFKPGIKDIVDSSRNLADDEKTMATAPLLN